jgi:hypothetical protein
MRDFADEVRPLLGPKQSVEQNTFELASETRGGGAPRVDILELDARVERPQHRDAIIRCPSISGSASSRAPPSSMVRRVS